MNFTKKLLAFAFAAVFLTALATIDVSAQRRGNGRVIKRPVIVRQYYYVRPDPFWYWNYYGDPFYYDPYYSLRQRQYSLERELRGNREELRKHLEKYKSDGVLTAKERKELEDDYRDVERAERALNEFNRRYARR